MSPVTVLALSEQASQFTSLHHTRREGKVSSLPPALMLKASNHSLSEVRSAQSQVTMELRRSLQEPPCWGRPGCLAGPESIMGARVSYSSQIHQETQVWVPGRVPLPVRISPASVGKAGQNQRPLCRARERQRRQKWLKMQNAVGFDKEKMQLQHLFDSCLRLHQS